jgi:hypothetical protein
MIVETRPAEPAPATDEPATGPPPVSPPSSRAARVLDGALAGLDAALVACVALSLLYLLTGGVHLGVVSVRRLSKPLLVLLVLAATRAAVPRTSWLGARLAAARRTLAALAARADARTPWAAAAGNAAYAVALVHGILKAATFLANVVFLPARERPFAMPFGASRLAETFAAWDSGWYFDIARRGYYFREGGQSSIAFFPLYPMLVRALAWPFGGSDRALWTAGIAISIACFWLALVVLHRFTERTFGDRESARRTVLYVAVFPFSYFLTQVYTESLFLLLAVSAVACAASARWPAAGVLGALVALTRPNGVLIAVPLGLMALAGGVRRPGFPRRAAAVALVPAGLGLFCAYAARLTGDPLAWLHAQDQWGYTVGNRPWVELMRLLDGIGTHGLHDYFFSDPLAPYYFLHGAVALTFVGLLPSVFTRVSPALGAWVAVSLYVPLTGNALEGVGRYAATLFPVFMLLGRATSQRWHETILVGSALVLSVLSAMFVKLFPVY